MGRPQQPDKKPSLQVIVYRYLYREKNNKLFSGREQVSHQVAGTLWKVDSGIRGTFGPTRFEEKLINL